MKCVHDTGPLSVHHAVDAAPEGSDLTLTCTSVQSRNYQFGMALGRGQSVAAIMAGGAKLAEGVATTPVAEALAKSLDVEAPLIGAVHAVLSGSADIATVVAGLMSRPLKRED